MTPLQRIILRGGEIRTRLAELGGIEELGTDDQRAESDRLRNEYMDVERRTASLTIAEDIHEPSADAPEVVELETLRTRSNVGNIFDVAIGHGNTSGAEREIQEHYGLGANQVPLSLLTSGELRTRAVTPAPATVAQNQSEIIPYVFPMSAAAFLGVDMPTVGVGEAVYPVLTSELAVGTPAENASQAETTGSFSADALSPSRIQAAFFYSREDRARFAGMDASLRENLSMGLSDGLDKQVLNGTNGLFNGTVLANHNVTSATTWDLYMSQLVYGRVDGRYANVTGDVRMVVGSATYGDMGATYRNASVDRSVLDRLMDVTGGVRVSAHVPAAASNRQNVVIKRGNNRDMVAPVWEGVTIIPDEVTKAASGQIVITAVMLHAVKLLRSDGFYKQQIQTS